MVLNTNYHHITITDNGIGFEKQYKDKIFEIFQRLHDRKEYEGTVIGLTIARKIIENHGGKITAESDINEGSTFHIYLPELQ
ncbi:sensor histidine kinase [Flavobacterium sp. GNP001]